MKRLIAAVLAVSILLCACPMSVFALWAPAQYGYGEQKDIVLHTEDGDVAYDAAWNELFPYGTFAFGSCEMNVAEGAADGTQKVRIPVYRLGGTEGRATVLVEYTPAASEQENGELSYAWAASAKTDVKLSVEDAQPIAAYQKLGQDPVLPAPDGVTLTAEKNSDGQYEVMPCAGDDAVKAEAYRWQSYNFELGRWTTVVGASEAVLPLDEEALESEDGYENDFRCIYTVDGQLYCTPTLIFKAPYDPAEDAARQAPAGTDYVETPAYTELTMENTYDACGFDLTFADGEWVKTIEVEALDDSEVELDEMGLFTITGCIGGSDTTVCNTLTLGVIDDEAPQPSSLGFVATDVVCDQDDGTATVTLERTGCLGYVVTVKYRTEDGTAKAGKQYTASSGEITLGGDICRAEIKVPLLAQARRTQPLDFAVCLSDVRGGGGLCTLTGDDRVTVSLTSGGKAKESGRMNIASMTANTAAADRAGDLTVTDKALLSENEAPTVNAVQTPADALTGRIVVGNTYDYTEGIRFYRKDITNYAARRYWKDSEYVTGDAGSNTVGYAASFQKPTYEKNSRKPDGKIPKETFNVSDSSIELAHNDSTVTPATLTVPDAGRLFSRADWNVRLYQYGIARWDGDTKLKERNYRYVMPYLTAAFGDQSWAGNFNFSYFTNDTSPVKRNPETGSLDFAFGNTPFTYTMGMVLHQNGQSGPTSSVAQKKYANGCTDIKMRSLQLTRRVFAKTGELGLRIFTANDEDTKGAYAALDPQSQVYRFLRPTVSLVEGAGGVDTAGHLYVGSKLYVELNSSASYTPYAGTTADETVYLTKKDGTKVPAQVEKAGSKDAYYITLLWDGMTLDDVQNGEYRLNVIVTRKQTLTVDLTPSLLRDENGKARTDTASYEAAWNKLVHDESGKTRTVTVVASAVTDKEPYYAAKTYAIPAETLLKSRSGATVTVTPEADPRLCNLQSVCFGLDPQDKVMFGGLVYAGDEAIPLSLSDLASGHLTFRFYDADFLSEESETAAAISHTELFYDANGNGAIDGYYDEKIGYFIPDAACGDVSLGMIEGEIPETDLLPDVDADGTVHQYFLKVYYTVTPRSLTKKTEDLLQILPAFISAQTDEESLSLLTEEEKSYRVIKAGSTNVRPYDKKAGTYGEMRHIDDTAADHPMYGAEASNMATLDIPLGGDTRYYAGSEVTVNGVTKPLACTDFCGNLRLPFENPSAITLRESGGTNYAIQDVNGYLGAFVDITTFILCTQTQRPIRTLQDVTPETVTMGTVKTQRKTPDMTDIAEEPGGAMSFDTNMDGGSKLPSMDIAAKMNLPTFTSSLTSYFNVTTLNGNQVMFSIGVPVGKFAYSASSKNTKNPDGTEVNEKYTVDDNGNRVTTRTVTRTFRDKKGNMQTYTSVQQKVEDTPSHGFDEEGNDLTMHTTHTKTSGDGGETVYTNRTVIYKEWTDEQGTVHSEQVAEIVNHNPYDISGKALKGSSPVKTDVGNLGVNLSDLFSGKLFKPSDNYKKYTGNKENHFRTFAITFTIKLAAMMEYDNLKGEWNLTRAIFSGTAAISFRYEFRFIPIVYAYIKLSLAVTFSANARIPFVQKPGEALTAVAVPEIGSRTVSPTEDKPVLLSKGQWAVFRLNTDTRRMDGTDLNGVRLKFDGKVNMYVTADTADLRDPEGSASHFLTKGTLSSAGLTNTDVRMDSHTESAVYVALFAREDVTLYDCRELFVTGRTLTYDYTGINIDATAEAGLGLEFFIGDVELYLRFSLNIIVQLGGTNRETGERDSDMTYLAFSGSVGIDVQFLFFHWSMDFVGFYLTYSKPYPHGPSTLKRGWEALGRTKPLGSAPFLYESDDGTVKVRARAPYNTGRSQMVVGTIPSNAFDPSDVTVPFQFSGYGATGDGYTLVDNLVGGYTYESFTVGKDSYILYPISVQGVANDVDATQLVMSRVAVTGEETGLVNPLDPARPIPYIVVDDHAGAAANTGDLDFSVDVDGTVVTVAWTGYDAPFAAGDVSMEEASKHTVVKRATLDLADDTAAGFTGHTVLSEGTGVYRQTPKVVGDTVFYGQTNGYATVDKKIGDYAAYLIAGKGLTQEEIDKGQTTPDKSTDLFRYTNVRSLAQLNGDGTTLVAVKPDGSRVCADIAGDTGECLAAMTARKTDDACIVAYTTQSTAYFDAEGTTVTGGFDSTTEYATVKRMYLRTFDGTAWGEPVLMRTLVDFENCNDNNIDTVPLLKDGVYADGRLSEEKADPHFGDLKFLTADPDGTGVQTVLLFTLNGNTYLFEEKDLAAYLAGGTASVRPVFSEDAGQNVTIGCDSTGKMMALYTKTVEGTPNTALYVSWWDSVAGAWGESNLLAMNHLQVYEDRVKYGLSADELEQAFLGNPTGNADYDAYIAEKDAALAKGETNTAKGAMDCLTFSGLQTAVVRVTSDDESEEREQLIAFAQGQRTTLLSVTDKEGEEERSHIITDGEEARVGFYAIAFGAGEQQVAGEYARLDDADFAAGTRLTGTVGFDNLGTAALRGSEANPITVELKAVAADGAYLQSLATWEITSNVVSGAHIDLELGSEPLTADLPQGTYLVLTVSEDAAYIEASGGTAYGSISDPLFTVGSSPELAIEKSTLTFARVVGDHAYYDVDMTVTNRGTLKADGLCMQFTSEDADGVRHPLDITGSSLVVEQEQPLRLTAAPGNDYAHGVAALADAAGKRDLSPGCCRHIHGTLCVPKSAYLEDALHLTAELFSDYDDYTVAGGLYEVTHNEQLTEDNTVSQLLRHMTVFAQPLQIQMAVGATLSLSCLYTSTTDKNDIVVREISDGEETWHPILGILSYRDGEVTAVPSGTGSTVIQLEDRATNSFVEVAVIVSEREDCVNVGPENPDLTFVRAEGSKKANSWVMEYGVDTWSGDTRRAPMNNDICVSTEKGSALTIGTTATGMVLYYDGEVTVTSDTFADYMVLEQHDGWLIASFRNHSSLYHNITVTAGSAGVQVDRYVLTYDEQAQEAILSDVTAPLIRIESTYPAPGSLKERTAVQVGAYITDETLLAGAVWYGTVNTALTKLNNKLWYMQATVSENGLFSIEAADANGNIRAYSYNVDWYAPNGSTTLPETPVISSRAGFVDEYNNPVERLTREAYLRTGPVEAGYATLIYSRSGDFDNDREVLPYIQKDSSGYRYHARKNGFYLLRIENDGVQTERVFYFDKVGVVPAQITVTQDGSMLDIKVTSETSIDEIRLSDEVIATDAGTEFHERVPIAYGGVYTVAVTNGLNTSSKEFDAVISVSYDWDKLVLQSKDETGINAVTFAEPETVTGGDYAARHFSERTGTNTYDVHYEFGVAPVIDGTVRYDLVEWQDGTTVSGFENERYAAVIRSSERTVLTSPIYQFGETLNGKVTIEGDLYMGQTVKAVVENANNTSPFRYTWYKVNTSSGTATKLGAAGDTLTLTKDVAAAYIRCEVTTENEVGKIVCTTDRACRPKVTDTTAVYDGKPHTVGGSYSYAETGFAVKFGPSFQTGSNTPPAYTDVGEYNVRYGYSTSAIIGSIAHYDNATVTITKKPIDDPELGVEVTFDQPSKLYTGKPLYANVTGVTVDGLDVTYDVYGKSATEVGKHTVVITGNGNFKGSVTAEWEIVEFAGTVDVVGTCQVGQTLRTNVTPNVDEGRQYQWYRYPIDNPYQRILIEGATAPTYTLTADDALHYVECVVSHESLYGVIPSGKTELVTIPAAGWSGEYDGKPHTVTFADTCGCRIVYSDDTVSPKTEPPTYTDVCDRTIAYYLVSPGGIYVKQSANVVIREKDVTRAKENAVTVKDNCLTFAYTGEPITLTVQSAASDGLPVTYSVYDNTATKPGIYTARLITRGNFTGIIPVTWSIEGDPLECDVTVEGKLMCGNTLTATVTGANSEDLHYQWCRYTGTSPKFREEIPGATDPSFVLTKNEIACNIVCCVTAGDKDGHVLSERTDWIHPEIRDVGCLYDGKAHTVKVLETGGFTVNFPATKSSTPPSFTEPGVHEVAYTMSFKWGNELKGTARVTIHENPAFGDDDDDDPTDPHKDPQKDDPHKKDPHKKDPHKKDPHKKDPQKDDPHKKNPMKPTGDDEIWRLYAALAGVSLIALTLLRKRRRSHSHH